MLIAREKKKSNIAEYILYMWQVEDMLRALGLDMKQIERHIVARFEADEETGREIHDWYDNLIAIMKQEKVETKGRRPHSAMPLATAAMASSRTPKWRFLPV